jgi:GNAT superfamily N-acetyltransferase
MATPVIREPARDDAAPLAALMGELGYPATPEEIWARIERMASARQRTLLAEVDGRVAGFVGFSALAIYESDMPTCWIMALCVGSHFRRHGIGRALIAAVERWCAEAGIPDMRAHSGEGRAGAHCFYEACGFQRAGVRFKKSVR